VVADVDHWARRERMGDVPVPATRWDDLAAQLRRLLELVRRHSNDMSALSDAGSE
jgi:hypothetical protein